MDILSQIVQASEPLERVSNIDADSFKKNFIKKKRPVIINGLAKKWPAYNKWNLDFFSNLKANEPIDLEIGNVMQNESQFEEHSFKSYIKKLQGGELDHSKDKAYLSMFEVFDQFPGLVGDVDFSYLTNSTVDDVPAAWIGPKGTVTGFHTDNYNNMLAQIMGKKLVLIASPRFNKQMYPSKKFDLGSTLSQVDINNYDEKEFPNIKEVHFYKAELNPGDVLFNPKGWWHYVKSLDVSISVNNFGYSLRDSILLKPIEAIKVSLHYRGLYRTKDCTCHRYENGVRIAK